MKLTQKLAEQVIQRLRSHLDVPINLMDTSGKIVASSDPSREDQAHSGAMKVIEDQEELIIHSADLAKFPDTKPGVNLPIRYLDELIGVVGITGEPDEVLQAANITKAAVEIALEQIHLQQQAAFQEIAQSNWFLQLIHPLGFDEEKLVQDAAHILKIDPDEQHSVIIMVGKVDIDELSKSLNSIFITKINDTENVLALKDPQEPERLLQLFKRFEDLKIGIGNSGTGLVDMRDSYFQAKKALQFAEGLNQRISHINDWKIERLIDQIPERTYSAVFEQYEKRLAEMGDSYVQTLRTFFECNLEMKETAENLHVHRNTLMYRLDQINEKVRLNPRDFKGSILLYFLCFKYDQFVQMHKNVD